MKTQIKTPVVTHKNFHLDEATSLLMLMLRGKEKGITVGDLFFCSSNEESREFAKNNDDYIFLGVANGNLDEHSLDGSSSLNESTVSLTAEKLSIKFTDKQLGDLMRYSHHNDNNGPTISAELANLIKIRFSQGANEQEVIQWFYDVITARIDIFSNSEPELLKENFNSFKQPSINKAQYEKLRSINVTTSSNYKRFVLSKFASFNDIVAKIIAAREGESSLGVTYKTKTIFVDPHNFNPRTSDLVIGFGDGIFADFPAEKMYRACNLHKSNEHKYGLLMDYVRNVNLRPGYHPFELAALHIVTQMRDDMTDWEKFIWTNNECKLFLNKQSSYNNLVRQFKKGIRQKKYHSLKKKGKDMTLKIAIINDGNDPSLSPVAMSKKGGFHDIVIMHNSNGHIVIQTRRNGKFRFRLDSVAFNIRLREAKIKGVKGFDYKTFNVEGSVSVVPEWYYHKPVEALMNGSLSHPDIPVTQLSKDIINSVVIECVENFLGIAKSRPKKRKFHKKSA